MDEDVWEACDFQIMSWQRYVRKVWGILVVLLLLEGSGKTFDAL